MISQIVVLCYGLAVPLGAVNFDLSTVNVVISQIEGVQVPRIIDLEARWLVEPDDRVLCAKGRYFLNMLLISLHVRFGIVKNYGVAFGQLWAEKT